MQHAGRTLNRVLREERKDVHFVHISSADDMKLDGAIAAKNAARACLLAWLQEHLPDTRIEPICPAGTQKIFLAEHADLFWIDFDAAGLAKFRAAWEEADGICRNPHIHCHFRSFNDWKTCMAACLPTFDRPKGFLAGWFWDTPKGFLHHAAPAFDNSFQDSVVTVCTKADDVWFMAGERVPEWRELEMPNFVGGRIDYHLVEQQWRIYIGFAGIVDFEHYPRNGIYRDDPEKQRQICEWFGLPPERVEFKFLNVDVASSLLTDPT